jgi:hypothetical protein
MRGLDLRWMMMILDGWNFRFEMLRRWQLAVVVSRWRKGLARVCCLLRSWWVTIS